MPPSGPQQFVSTVATRFLTADVLPSLFHFPPDLVPSSGQALIGERGPEVFAGIKTSSLDQPELLRYYLRNAKNWR